MTPSRIIIPSAKLVPEELWNLGKLPGIIYPINQRIVFDYLYEQYKGFNIDIICYEKADKVRRRLEKYINNGVRISILDTLSDLGHTVYFALRDVSEPVIINFADTIVMDDISALAGTDAFYCPRRHAARFLAHKFYPVSAFHTDVFFLHLIDFSMYGGVQFLCRTG